MKMIGTLLLIGIIGPQSALAVQRASPEDRAAIQQQLARGFDLDQDVRAAKLALEQEKDKVRKKQMKKETADTSAVLAAEREYRRLQDLQSAEFTKAIYMAAAAYGLDLAGKKGTSVSPATRGRVIEWLPVAREPEARTIRAKDGKEKDIKQPDTAKYAGATYADGVTYVYRNAFENGPDFLAQILLHEKVHFEQFTTPGKGDRYSSAEAEQEAYQAEVDNQSNPNTAFLDPAKDEWTIKQRAELLESFKGDVNAQRQAEKGVLGMIRRILPHPDPDDFVFTNQIHTNEELASIQENARLLRRQIQDEADQRRLREWGDKENRRLAEKRRAEENARIVPAAKPIVHPDWGCFTTCNAVHQLAARSCADPGSVSDADLKRVADEDDGVPFTVAYAVPPEGTTAYCETLLFWEIWRRRPNWDAASIRLRAIQLLAPAKQPSEDPAQTVSPPSAPDRERPQRRDDGHNIPNRTWKPTFRGS